MIILDHFYSSNDLMAAVFPIFCTLHEKSSVIISFDAEHACSIAADDTCVPRTGDARKNKSGSCLILSYLNFMTIHGFQGTSRRFCR